MLTKFCTCILHQLTVWFSGDEYWWISGLAIHVSSHLPGTECGYHSPPGIQKSNQLPGKKSKKWVYLQGIHGKSAWRRTELKGTGRVHLLKR